ncbi:hypothetical protein [Microbacterium sp. 22242]|uniref:hypothetical protein n=1 Tax=Microbacterium sp. 22242 TaxID=3453896 RepID=UPI003F838445
MTRANAGDGPSSGIASPGIRRFLRYGIAYPIALALYAYVMHWVYASLISPAFGYLGNKYQPAPFSSHVVTFFIALFTAYALPRSLKRPSSMLLWIIYAVAAVPTIFMTTYTTYLAGGEDLAFSALVGGSMIAAALIQNRSPRPWRLPKVSSTSITLFIAVFSIVTYASIIATKGLNTNFLAFADVYGVRADFADQVDEVGILGYLVPIQANVINAYIFAAGIARRRVLFLAIAIIGQLLLYTTTGSKGMFFAILTWLLMFLLLRRRQGNALGITFIFGAAGVMVVSTIIDTLTASSTWTSFFSRRVITVPGALSSAYFRFYSDNPQAHLGYSLLAPFMKYPYDLRPPYVIGNFIAHLPSMAASANLFADGYSNFGWAGVLASTLILGVYLRFLDRATFGWPPYFVGIVMVSPAIAVTNASILTSLTTHGLLAALLLLAVSPLVTSKSSGEPDLAERRMTKPSQSRSR